MRGFEREEGTVLHTPWGLFGERNLGELVIKRTRQLGLEPVADEHARRRTLIGGGDPQGMPGAEDHRVTAVEAEGDAAIAPFAFALHLERAEGACARPRYRAFRPA